MSSLPPRAPRPLLDVALAIVGLHLAFFVLSVASFAIFQGSTENRFTEVARSEYLGFIALRNAKLLVGYLLISAVHVAALHPVLAALARRRGHGRWKTRGLAALSSVVLTIVVAFGVATTKPFLLAGPIGRFYWKVKGWTPWFVADVVFTPWFFQALLVVSIAGLAIHYARLAVRWGRERPRPATVGLGGFALVAVVAVAVFRVAPSSAAPPHPQPPSRRFNVLVLAADSLRGDRLGANGYERPTTPRIDRLAAEGANFRFCMTPVGSTLEGWHSILTGQYPHTHGMRHMFPSRAEAEAMAANPALLTKILGAQGYRTAVVSDWAGNNFRLVDYGFDEVEVRHVQNFEVFITEAVMMCHPLILAYFQNPIGQALFPELEILTSNRTPDQVTHEVIESLERFRQDGDPFFVVGFYSCTHLPFSAKHPYYELFTDPGYDGPNKTEIEFDVDEFITGGFRENISRREIGHIRDLYDGTVRQFDDHVAKVMDYLEASGLAENTIVVITSDHGDDLYEPGTSLGHGISFNGGDQTNHIPLVIRMPDGSFRGAKVDGITRAIDLAPTLLELLGLPPHEAMDGVSLVPAMKDPAQDPGLVFYGETSYLFFRHPIPGEKLLPLDSLDVTTYVDPTFDHNLVLHEDARELMLRSKERCIRTPEWKLILTPGDGYDIHRLYHVPTDPHCEKNLAKERPEEVAKLRRWLDLWMKENQEVRVHRDGRVEE